MKVKDAMHKGVDWVSPDTPVTELAKLMRDHDVGAIPIGENDRLVGMVTDRDRFESSQPHHAVSCKQRFPGSLLSRPFRESAGSGGSVWSSNTPGRSSH
jgi:CBS-domain-containing membrane protein